MTNRPAWTLSEAAERTTASRSTLRRYQADGKFPGAYKDNRNAWRFPIEDLLAAGIELVRVTPTEQPTDLAQASPDLAQPTLTPAEAVDKEAEERIRRLEMELAVERERVAGLQQLVSATNRGNEDLRMALRIIEAPKPKQEPTEPPAAAQPAPKIQEQQPIALPAARQEPPAPQEQPRRGWLARTFLGE